MLTLFRLMCAESSGLFSGTRTTPGRHVRSRWMTRSWSHFPSVLRPGSSRSGGGCRDDVSSTTPLMRPVSITFAVQSSWKWFNFQETRSNSQAKVTMTRTSYHSARSSGCSGMGKSQNRSRTWSVRTWRKSVIVAGRGRAAFRMKLGHSSSKPWTTW